MSWGTRKFVRVECRKKASGEAVASWETEKLFFGRDEEARRTTAEVYHRVGKRCRKVTDLFVLHQWKCCMENDFIFFIYPCRI